MAPVPETTIDECRYPSPGVAYVRSPWCLHLNNRNKFEKYLVNRSYLDTYSTTRSEYAKIEKTIDGDLIFKLNLVID